MIRRTTLPWSRQGSIYWKKHPSDGGKYRQIPIWGEIWKRGREKEGNWKKPEELGRLEKCEG
jgi:hypothetical protein